MLFRARVLAGVQDGSVDRAFRRWERPLSPRGAAVLARLAERR